MSDTPNARSQMDPPMAFMWRGTVSTAADLPQNGSEGDSWVTTDTGHIWIRNGSSWQDRGFSLPETSELRRGRLTTPEPETGPSPSVGQQAEKDVRLSLRLSPEARAAVEQIMKLGNMDSMQEAIRRAIGEELFLMQERRAGWKVLLQKGERYREVIFPHI